MKYDPSIILDRIKHWSIQYKRDIHVMHGQYAACVGLANGLSILDIPDLATLDNVIRTYVISLPLPEISNTADNEPDNLDFRALCQSSGLPVDMLARLCGVSVDRMQMYICGARPVPARVRDIVSAARIAVTAALRSQYSAAGKIRTAKRTAARKRNIANLNASYTPEKRRAAAQKRLATLRSKKTT